MPSGKVQTCRLSGTNKALVSLKVANFEDFWVKLPMKRGPQLMWRQMRPNVAPQIPKTGNIEKMPFSGV